MSKPEFGKTTFKSKIDIEEIWLRHMDRTNQSAASDTGTFDAYVRQQLRLLPLDLQNWVLGQSDTYTYQKNVLMFKTSPSGVDLGYKENPLVWNKNHTKIGLSSHLGFTVERFVGDIDWDDPNITGKENTGSEEDPIYEPILDDETIPVKRLIGEIDWADINIYSPYIESEPEIDYEAFNQLVLTAAERAGLSWKVELHTYDMGDVPKKTKKKRALLPMRTTSTGKKLPIIPSGYDTRIISTIPDTNLNIIDWHGTKVVQGTGYSPIFFDLIQERTNGENGTIIGTGGAPGDGKTYFCSRLGEILTRVKSSRRFNPYIQIPFTQEHFLWLLSKDTPLKPGDVIVLDEAHFAAGARNWFKEDQKEFVDLIASARNMGFIVILVVLHMTMLDKILRNFTMAFYIHLEKPGYAIAYKTFTPRFNNEMMKSRIGPVTLQLPNIADCEHPRCLHCNHLYPKSKDIVRCYVGRAIYERRKKVFQNIKIETSRDRRKMKEEKQRTDDDYYKMLDPFWGSKINMIGPVATVDADIAKVLREDCDMLEPSNRLITRLRKRRKASTMA